MGLEIIGESVQGLFNVIPKGYRGLFFLVIYTFFVVVYSIFIWKFYKFLSSRDIFHLNLRQYNYSKHPVLEKFFAVILYITEYLVILPFLVLFWFAVLSLFLLILSEAESVKQILMIAAAIVAAIRVTSYVSEELSRDVAKILPFTILALFIIKTDFLDLEKLLRRFIEIPSLFKNVLIFVVFIFVVEFVLRIFYLVVDFFSSEAERVEKEKL